MRNRNRSVSLVNLCALAVCGLSTLRADNSEQVSVPVGDEFTVKLASIPGTGYSWTLTRSLPSWLEKVDKTYAATTPGLLGGDGAECWKFRAAATGSTTLAFQYKRPWEGAPIKVRVYKVTATPPTEADNISVAAGEQFTVALASKPSTGYSWTRAGSLPAWLEHIGKTYVAANPESPGGGGTEYWTFGATAAGGATLTFQYGRSREGKPVQTHVCQVTAAPTADPALALYLSFDEGAGATVNDLSRCHNRATITGATWVPGQSGTALEFADGSHVTVPAIPAYDATSALTLLAWVKATTNPIWSRVIDKSEYPANGFSLCLTADNGSPPRFEFCVNDTIAAMTSKTVVLDGQWHFIAATFGSKTLRLYVDGRKEAEVPSLGGADIKPNHCPVTIGGSASSNHAQQYYGSIDEVAMYNRELSADEVLALFQKGTSSTPSTGDTRGDRTEPRPAGST